MSIAAKRLVALLIFLLGAGGCSSLNPNTDPNPLESSSATPVPVIGEELVTGEAVAAENTEVAILKIAQVGNMTGLGSEFTLPNMRGLEDGIARLLATGELEDGEWTLTSFDTQGSQELARQFWEQDIINSEAMIVYWWDYELLTEVLEEIATFDGLVFVPYASVEQLGTRGPANLFSLSAALDAEFVYALSRLTDTRDFLPDSVNSGNLNVALLRWPNEFGGSALTTWSREKLADIEVDLVYEGTLLPSYTWDAAPEVRAALRAEANVVYVQGYAHAPAIVVEELARQGAQGDVVVMGPSLILDQNIYGYVSTPALFNGVLAPSHLAWWIDNENSAVENLRLHLLEAGLSPAELSRGRLIGALAVEILHEAMQIAVSQNSGGEVTVNAIRLALFKLDLSMDDEFLGNVNYQPSRRYPDQLEMRRVESFAEFGLWP